MKLFTIHIQKYGLDPEPDLRAIKEGFSWPAFVFSFFWAIVKGYWLVAICILVVSGAISLALGVFGLDLFGQAVVNIAFNMLVGFFANDMARWTLAQRGYVEEEVVSGVSRDHALEQYLHSLQTI